MRITIKRLEELGASREWLDMFPRFPGLSEDGSADVRELCMWAVRDGGTIYAWWLLPRLMTPTGAAEWAIRCARTVRGDETWLAWAEKWLSGEDRSKAAAVAAALAWSRTHAAAARADAAEAEACAACAAWAASEAAAAAVASHAATAHAAASSARMAAEGNRAAAWAWEAALEAAAWAWEAAAGFASEAADEMIGLAIQIIDREKGV